MASDWSGLLVVSATPLTRAMVEALLRSGANAVVAPAEDESGLPFVSLMAMMAGAEGGAAEGGFRGGEAGEGAGVGVGVGVERPRAMVRATSSVALAAEAAAEQPSPLSPIEQPPWQQQQPPAAVISAGAAEAGRARAELEASVLAFFSAFYEALYEGQAVLGAIKAGERAAAALDGVFVCYHL